MKIILSTSLFFIIATLHGMEPSADAQNALWCDVTSKQSTVAQSAMADRSKDGQSTAPLTIEWATALWQNPTHKKYQEDKITCIQLKDGYFFGVYDGHGSYRSDNNVSSYLKANLHLLFEKSEKETIQEKFEDAFAQAEAYALAEEERVRVGSFGGSTAVVAYIDEKQILHLAWVGDSRAVLEKKHKVAYATTDHNTDNPSELERIKAHNLCIKDHHIYNKIGDWLAMSRSIGDRFCKDVTPEKPLGIGGIIAIPEYHQIQLTTENHFLIMATDGLWDGIGRRQAVCLITLVRHRLFDHPWISLLPYLEHDEPDACTASADCSKSIQFAIKKLGQGALVRESKDNIGIVIVQFKWQESAQ